MLITNQLKIPDRLYSSLKSYFLVQLEQKAYTLQASLFRGDLMREVGRIKSNLSSIYLERGKEPIVNIHIDTLNFLFYLHSLLFVEIFLRRITKQGTQLSHLSVTFRVICVPSMYSLSREGNSGLCESKHLNYCLLKQQKFYYKNVLCHFILNSRFKIYVIMRFLIR